jgi:hypothetical protein
MMRLFSKTTLAAYPAEDLELYRDAGTLPGDLVEVTDEAWAEIMAAEGAGKVISSDANGYPIAIDAPPRPLADLKTALSVKVDDAISAIYSRFTRFTSEYELREAAARAYKTDGYTGTPGSWIMSFATPAGLSATQATDLIISQADTLRTALATLGALRMRKYEIASAADAVTAQAIHDDIVLKATVAAEGL